MEKQERISRDIKRKSLTGKVIVKDKNYYLQNMDIEEAILNKAVIIAERIFTAFIRENNIQVSLDADDLTDKIVKKLGDKIIFKAENLNIGNQENKKSEFSFDDDEPIVIKTTKTEIKGADKIIKETISEDDIDKNLDALSDFEL